MIRRAKETYFSKHISNYNGVILDCYFNLYKYINATYKSSIFHIENIGCIQNCLSDESATIVFHAFITNKLDYCNSLLNLANLQVNCLGCLTFKFNIFKKFKIMLCDITPIAF